MKKQVILFLLVLAVLISSVFGVYSALAYRHFKVLEIQNRQMTNQVNAADAMGNHQKAVALFKAVKPKIPAVELRILQRQWLIALDLLDQIQAARYNLVLEKELPILFQHLSDHLDDMKDRCTYVLTEFEPLRQDVAWRVYNIKGAVNLLRTFVVLETENIREKVSGTMKEAISDLKSAIEIVDRTNAPGVEKNIPRWNMELLQANKYIKKISVSKMDAQRRLDLKENLEAIIPEKGGYSPGEPLDRRMKK